MLRAECGRQTEWRTRAAASEPLQRGSPARGLRPPPLAACPAGTRIAECVSDWAGDRGGRGAFDRRPWGAKTQTPPPDLEQSGARRRGALRQASTPHQTRIVQRDATYRTHRVGGGEKVEAGGEKNAKGRLGKNFRDVGVAARPSSLYFFPHTKTCPLFLVLHKQKRFLFLSFVVVFMFRKKGGLFEVGGGGENEEKKKAGRSPAPLSLGTHAHQKTNEIKKHALRRDQVESSSPPRVRMWSGFCLGGGRRRGKLSPKEKRG